VASEVGIDAADGDGIGFLLRCAGGPEQHRADARETVGLDNRHEGFLVECPRQARVLLLGAARMVSKRRQEGKGRMSHRHAAGTAIRSGFHPAELVASVGGKIARPA
jgi:hypothetical protein